MSFVQILYKRDVSGLKSPREYSLLATIYREKKEQNKILQRNINDMII